MKTEPIHLRKGLSLYKQPITSRGGSRYWYARVWMRIGERELHTKSSGTTDVVAAKRFAEDLYAECLMLRRYGAVPGSGSVTPMQRFDVIADQWLDQKKALAGSDPRKFRAYDDSRKLLSAPNGLGAFFKRTDIASITTDQVRDYLAFAAEHSKKGGLATTTQRNHLSTLNAILKYAVERRLMVAAPPMPKLRLKDNPRPCFTEDEYRALCACAGVLKRIGVARQDHSTAARWEEMEHFLVFMVATFLRAGEWKELRQKHCRIVEGYHPFLEVAVPDAKTRKRKAVSMPEAIPVFQRIIERDGEDPERFLFLNRYPNRATAKERMDDYFKELLKEAGLEFDEFGNKRTIYSLRHTALMLRLLNGNELDLLMLAKNAGTSVNQLERFYLSHAEPAMKVASLHSSKPKPEIIDDEGPEIPRGAIQLAASINEPETLGLMAS